MKHIFKIGDGMTIENSTAEERKEIMKLIFEKGYPTIRNEFDYIDFEFSDCVLFMENGFGTSKKVTTPLTYAQMKALILGEKWNFKYVVAAVRDGSHQIEKDCCNPVLINEIYSDILGRNPNSEVLRFSKMEGISLHSRVWNFENLPIIKLSEIMPKEESDIPTDERLDKLHKLFCDTLKLSDKIAKNIDQSNKLKSKQQELIERQKELISQRDCIGRDIPVEEKPVELEVERWYKGSGQFEKMLIYVRQKIAYCNETNHYAYGFNGLGEWMNEMSQLWSIEQYGFKPATTSEITEALKNEAIKKGYKKGVTIKYDGHLGEIKGDIYYAEGVNCLAVETYENTRNNEFFPLLEKGVWTEIIPTLTRKKRSRRKIRI